MVQSRYSVSARDRMLLVRHRHRTVVGDVGHGSNASCSACCRMCTVITRLRLPPEVSILKYSARARPPPGAFLRMSLNGSGLAVSGGTSASGEDVRIHSGGGASESPSSALGVGERQSQSRSVNRHCLSIGILIGARSKCLHHYDKVRGRPIRHLAAAPERSLASQTVCVIPARRGWPRTRP